MVLMVILLLSLTIVSGDGWMECEPCKCVWNNGKKTATCTAKNFTDLPKNLSNEIQVLDLNDNFIRSLSEGSLRSARLINLHRLKMRNCSLQVVDRKAFSDLKVLIEIDLSYNEISSLDPITFRGCEKIRVISLTGNPLKSIGEGLFSNLVYLQEIDLKSCHIQDIAFNAFGQLPALKTLTLLSNQLSYLDVNTVQNLPNLTSLNLGLNPWKCDCKLRQLRDWALSRNILQKGNTIPKCTNWENQTWETLTPNQFACPPEIKELIQRDWILSCLAHGDPDPQIQWSFHGKLITNHSYTGAEYHFDNKGAWSNLTVRRAGSRDNGEYVCKATNEGGVVSRTLDAFFYNGDDDDSGVFGAPGSSMDVWPLVVGVVLGALLLLGIVLIVCCCFCKNQKNRVVGKKEANGSVGGGLEAEEKTLMSVNPVQKPPRRQETALNTSETELLGSGSLPYNDNGSLIGSMHNESQLDSSVGREPDLLAFSGKTALGSPTTKSQVSQFGTLPYARSHSPFSPPAPVVPRSGYVTIPRRPRVPSWTASLSPVLSPEDPTAIVEPVYDNLGPRTTADGSSVLSLNKVDLGIPAVFKNRPLPQTPFDSINDHRRQSWSRATPDVGDERQLLIATSPQPSITSAKKVPPNPPPKPKKKLNRLFDDEGEDGTEV